MEKKIRWIKRVVFHVRPLKFFFYRNWYGVRTGDMWDNMKLYDIGAITFGWKEKIKYC